LLQVRALAEHVDEGLSLVEKVHVEIVYSHDLVKAERLWESGLLVRNWFLLFRTLRALELLLDKSPDRILCTGRFQHREHLIDWQMT
jgi:6-phosphogluconate dehydrogenase (decarboxylating)